METLFPASFISNSSLLMQQRKNTVWTKEENKKFESALAVFDENNPNRWFMVAAMIPGKSVHDVINQYKELVSDISDIEAGREAGLAIKKEKKVYLGQRRSTDVSCWDFKSMAKGTGGTSREILLSLKHLLKLQAMLKNNSSSVTLVQKSIGTPKILLDWNHKNNGASMVFDSAYDDPFIAYPHDIASHGTCIVNTGAANQGFQFCFTGTFQSERSLE
ncbi:unnamed protein product [Fraxinus pennsylvanica]|uniref:Myb-like domain-containing protein n=1 Tax=Fraxinus pennsylvanica TaxID=56036 RepID=A0AAD1ZEG6_9LAMI|nr:unnamed protein product [Fraxinus pennsylvanica]